jgi:hypothetical protein
VLEVDQCVHPPGAGDSRAEGVLLQRTIGDKGSSVNAAEERADRPEDHRRRALRAALELLPAATTLGLLAPVPIGRACGIRRTGAYGQATRCISSVLGDALNLNAFVPPRPPPRQADRRNQKVTSADAN